MKLCQAPLPSPLPALLLRPLRIPLTCGPAAPRQTVRPPSVSRSGAPRRFVEWAAHPCCTAGSAATRGPARSRRLGHLTGCTITAAAAVAALLLQLPLLTSTLELAVAVAAQWCA